MSNVCEVHKFGPDPDCEDCSNEDAWGWTKPRIKKVRVWPKPWPKWYGCLIKWDKGPPHQYPPSGGFKLWMGECSHGTSWQIRWDTKWYSWYWVLRLWDFVEDKG